MYGFIAASAYYVCRSLPLHQRHALGTAVVYGAASLLSGLLWTLLCLAWNQAGEMALALAGLSPAGQRVALSPELMSLLVLLGSAMYLISLLIHDVFMALDKLRSAQSSEAESRVQARDAELQVLRSQIDPHFLFNSLNSISALTSLDAAAARSMTLELAEFFRKTLALSARERIPLSEEIALCGHFLAIEKVRFGASLSTDIQVSEPALHALLPPMLLQPCIENAVKHGVRHLAEGGTISLRASTRDQWLHVCIENPLDPQAPASLGTGTGLRNIERRLATLYGDQARVSWKRGADRFSLDIVLPLDPEGSK
jgi:LytS/YehU family sensor histidine kinase